MTTIAGLARAGDVGVETVRFYQRRGLIAMPDRSGAAGVAGGVRRYGAEDIRRLRFIRSAQTAGFTLDQIGELLALDATTDRARAQALATEQLAVLEAKNRDVGERARCAPPPFPRMLAPRRGAVPDHRGVRHALTDHRRDDATCERAHVLTVGGRTTIAGATAMDFRRALWPNRPRKGR